MENIKRLFIGEGPPWLLIEVFLRSSFLYLFLLLIVRRLGKRMSGQLTITEMAVMLTLGAMVSAPMQVPEKGIVQGCLVLLVALLLHWSVNRLSVRYAGAELLLNGRSSMLVRDGALLLPAMKANRISRQQLFAVLRNEQLFNLGQVERVYLEACGLFSIYTYAQPKPGLPVFPGKDQVMNDHYKRKSEGHIVCGNCGYVQPAAQQQACPTCQRNQWQIAVC